MLGSVNVLIAFALTVSVLALPVSAQDLAGSADHPLVNRYDGSEIVGYRVQEFEDFTAPLGPMERRDGKSAYADTRDIEGTLTRILYRAPKDRSTLEIIRNYENSLKEAGFQTIFECKKAECGGGFYSYVKPVWTEGWISQVFYGEPVNQRYLAARLDRPEGNLWAFVLVSEHRLLSSLTGPYVHLDVVQEAGMEQRMVRVDPQELSDDLTALGHTAIYGIYFDTDEARLRPESDQALAAIAELMKRRSDLRVHVVGHTDSVGSFDYNLDLSRRRATAVVESLMQQHGIAADRLTPNGVGPLAPVASNRSEDGRAKNRRVELVEQPD